MSPLPITKFLALVAAAAVVWPAQAAEYTWTGSTYVPGGTAPNPLPATDVLHITGPATKTFGPGIDWVINQQQLEWRAAGGQRRPAPHCVRQPV